MNLIKEHRERETARRGQELLEFLLTLPAQPKPKENMKVKPKTQTHCHCQRCQYVWPTRAGFKPKVCPRCKSYSWDQPYKRTPGNKAA